MIVILDTSVIMSMLLSKNRDNSMRTILAMKRKGQITFCISFNTLAELKNAISSNKYKKHINYHSRRTAQFINEYKHSSSLIKHEDVQIPEIRDKNDNIFLQLALLSNAHYLITGDKNLLEVKKVGKTRILKPAEFLKEYKRCS